MFCNRSAQVPTRIFQVTVLILWTLLSASKLPAAEAGAGPEPDVWLVTYGPGEVYWQRFGHNAIWIRGGARGLDHVFNFGFFDFEQEDFFLRFLQGRMLYFSAARPSREEFAAYIHENRSIRAQRLDLPLSRKKELTSFLLEEVRPENRDYLYDYYANNCSTRVRDAINLGTGGELEAQTNAVPAGQGWRDHTRRLTADDFWLYLGLEIVLGSPVDQAITHWDEMFIPAVLADTVAGLGSERIDVAAPLVVEDVMLYESTLDPAPAAPAPTWTRYLLASLTVLLAAWLACRLAPPGLLIGLSRGWLLITGAAGCALVFFWVGTDHTVAQYNLNLLVFNPLWIPLALWKGREKAAFAAVAGFSLLALLMTVLPPGQHNQDVLAAFLPLNTAAAWGLVRYRLRPAGRPGAPASGDR